MVPDRAQSLWELHWEAMLHEHVPGATASGESITPLLAVAPARFTSPSRHAVSTVCHTSPLPPLVASLLFVWALSLSNHGWFRFDVPGLLGTEL